MSQKQLPELSLQQKLLALRAKGFRNFDVEPIRQMSLFHAQQIREEKENTTTVRIDKELMSRMKRLARANNIKNHGKLMNMILEEVLTSLESL